MAKNRKYYTRSLSPRVLVVAIVNNNNPYPSDWCTYIDSVHGNNHDEDYENITENGTELPHDIAKLLFPNLELTYKWRD